MFWVEPFFNLDLIAESSVNDNQPDLAIKLQPLKFHSTVFKPSSPWDNHQWTTYFNVVTHPKTGKIFMYYRANLNINRTSYHHENTCVLVSEDGGYTFTQPELNLISYPKSQKFNPEGLPRSKKDLPAPPTISKVSRHSKNKKKKHLNIRSKATNIISSQIIPTTAVVSVPDFPPNNIIWNQDAITHNFYSFLNHQNNQLQAIGSCVASSCRCCANGIYLLKSDDGFYWEKDRMILSNKNTQKQNYGTCFDSINTIVWDDFRQEYRAFLRYNHARGVRCIQTCTSKDLYNWSGCQLLRYRGPKPGYFYAPIVCAYHGYFLGFPCSQPHDLRSSQVIDIMFSRDGQQWDIIKHKWMGSNSVSPERMVPRILLSPDQTENLIYINNARDTQVDLYTIRRDGLSCIMSKESNREVWFKTHPIYLSGTNFYLNYKLINSDEDTANNSAYLKVYFYQGSVDSNNTINNNINNDNSNTTNNNTKELISFTEIDSSDSLKYLLKLSEKMINQYVIVKFVLKNCKLYTFSYQTVRDKVILPPCNMGEYANVRERPMTPLVSSSRSVKKTRPTKEKKPAPEITPPEELDLTHLEQLNIRLKDNPTKVICYGYTDYLKNPDQQDEREYVFQQPVKEIVDFNYSNFNDRGGGCSTYGRTLKFTVIYDSEIPKSEVITLIKNSKSNCKVVFI